MSFLFNNCEYRQNGRKKANEKPKTLRLFLEETKRFKQNATTN